MTSENQRFSLGATQGVPRTVYVAGKWTDKESIRSRMGDVRELGHTITHDWTKVEHTDAPDEMLLYAFLDVKGVLAADIFIALLEDPKYDYRGTFTELGVALGHKQAPAENGQLGVRKQVWVVCPNNDAYARTNVFFQHPMIDHFNSWEACCKALSEYRLLPKNS